MHTMTSPLSFFLTPAGRFLAVSLPVLLVLGFGIILLASASVTGAKMSKVGIAVFHYLMQGAGIILMTLGALPTLLSVLVGPPYTGQVYMSLLWIFLVGGGIFLWHEQRAGQIDQASTAVVHAVFVGVVKTMGYFAALFSILIVLVTIAMGAGANDAKWWVSPAVFFLYGVLLYWSASGEEQVTSVFQSTALHHPAKHAHKKAQKKSWLGFLGLTKKKA